MIKFHAEFGPGITNRMKRDTPDGSEGKRAAALPQGVQQNGATAFDHAPGDQKSYGDQRLQVSQDVLEAGRSRKYRPGEENAERCPQDFEELAEHHARLHE